MMCLDSECLFFVLSISNLCRIFLVVLFFFHFVYTCITLEDAFFFFPTAVTGRRNEKNLSFTSFFSLHLSGSVGENSQFCNQPYMMSQNALVFHWGHRLNGGAAF